MGEQIVIMFLAALTALLGPWPAEADPPARFPAEVGECSIIRHLCSVDPEDGVTPVNEVTYLCPGGEVTISLPWPCGWETNNDQE